MMQRQKGGGENETECENWVWESAEWFTGHYNVTILHPHQSAAGHTGNQLGSLAAEDESSQIKEHTHHRQQDKHIDLEM